MPRLLCLSLALFALACSAPFVTADDDDPEPPLKTMSVEQILKKYPQNKDAIEKLYLSTLRRNPTVQESARWVDILTKASNGGEDERRKMFQAIHTYLSRSKELRDPKRPDDKD